MKRLLWVFTVALLPLFVLLLWISQVRATAVRAPFDVIINEWSQGNGGSKEWVELLVVNGPLDLRGWDLGDSSPGDLAFSNDTLWSNVPAGSLIVIYNHGDPDTVLPPDDTNLADCTLVLPHDDATYFSGGWPALANTTTTDNPHLRDSTLATIHDFSVDPGTTLHPNANQNAQYQHNTAVGVSNVANWSNEAASAASPGQGNTVTNTNWIASLCAPVVGEPDLAVAKTGPATAVNDSAITYTINIDNVGQVTATNVFLTDTLPMGLSYLSDDSGFMLSQLDTRTLVWQVGEVLTSTAVSFQLVAHIDSAVIGSITNIITATTSLTESNNSNNVAQATTNVSSSIPPLILLDAVLADGYEDGDNDEAVLLRNIGTNSVDLSQWQLRDGGTGNISLPAAVTLAPGEMIWLTKNNEAFQRQFGFAADFEAIDSDLAVPNLVGTWPGFANSGDKVILLDASDVVQDVLIFGDEDTVAQIGWSGTAVQPYQSSNNFASEGQIFYRQRDQHTALPVPDTNTAVDWAQSRADIINGRKVRYPGWDLDEFFFTYQVTQTADLRIAIAPDNAYEALVQEINNAQNSLEIESHTFENIAIADALIQAVNRGVAVTLLLEGGPPGGLPDPEKYNCQRLEAAGGQCWFMIADSSRGVFDRYRFIHAKFIIIDGQRVAISSENLSSNSLPNDDKSDGTWGRRGVVVITDAPGIVAHTQSVFERDFAPAQHVDLYRWTITDTVYGPPPIGFVPITETGGITYAVRYPQPLDISGEFAFEVVQSPESSLRDVDSLLGLIKRVGAGDELLVQQLEERPYWGASSSNASDDPNPRLEAYIAAARRGATVRLLLDSFFDDESSPTSNRATCDYVNDIAREEQLALACASTNPTGLGIHNKMVLARINGRGYIHVGSINGTEQSSKGNRELALQVQSDEAYALLADMFERDWPYAIYMPVLLNDYLGPAQHVLISEVLYDPPGQDDAEFIELVNPTIFTVNLSGYSLGDAVNTTDFEDVRRFPPGTMLAPKATLVVATSATAFRLEYGFGPDFEIVDTDTAVPDLIDDPNWGDPDALLQLGNAGDEVILRDGNDTAVDVVTYGTGSYPGQVACPLVAASNVSLERFPYWRDKDNCALDFREWPFPNPGVLPE